MSCRKFRLDAALLGILVLACGCSATSAMAVDKDGLYLCRISKPNGVVMVVELFGYEIDDVRGYQKDDYDRAVRKWKDGYKDWVAATKNKKYPVPKPVSPVVKGIASVKGLEKKPRAELRKKHRDKLEVWHVCVLADMEGHKSAKAVRSDYLRREKIRMMTRYAEAVIDWAEARKEGGDGAAAKKPGKPSIKTVNTVKPDVLKPAEKARALVKKLTKQLEDAGEAKPVNANPPTVDKAGLAEWPGLVTIYHGHNWGGDEKYVTAIKEANYGATGVAAWQIEHAAKRGLKAFVFLWAHEAKTVPAQVKDEDAVLCYYLGDRIPPNRWGAWAALEKQAYAGDPYHPAVFSMSPRAWGGIERYFPVVRGRAIEYYHYHWDGNRSPHMHFAYLEQYRRESAKHGNMPIIRLVETRAEDMRKTSQTIFTCLAYGVRGFQYGGGLFDTNKRDKRGVPTPHKLGKAAFVINQAIKSFSPVFEKARSVDVFQTPPLPPGTKEAPKDYWVRPAGQHVVMGEFADPKKKKEGFPRFLVLANRDAFNAHEATLRFAKPGLKVAKMNKKSGKWEAIEMTKNGEGSSVKVPLEAGGGELLRVSPKK